LTPAHPHLDRHRHRNSPYGGLDQFGSQWHVAHQRRAGVTIDDFADRTSHIDVDDRRTAILNQLGCLAHLRWVATDELHRDRFLDLVPHGLLHRDPRFADCRGTSDHFGNV
jgi:hypothetical protein